MNFIIHVNNFIVNQYQQILLVKEKKELSYSKYNLPGGHLNIGEYIEHGAIREAKEEVSINIEPTQLLKIFTGFNGEKHFIQFIYLVEVNNIIAIANSNEVLSCEWLEISKLKGMDNTLFLNYNKIVECIDCYENKEFVNKSIIKELY